MNNESSFLGTGWAFPPEFDRAAGSVKMVSGKIDIDQSLEILLSTTLGERVMQPQYGCDLRRYQMEPSNNSFLGFLRDLVERAILFHEPRITLEKVKISEANGALLLEGKIIIEITYQIAETNTRSNFVFPFYLKEADAKA